MKKCPEAVEQLIEYLKSTGTGKSKLKALNELGCKCKDSEEFIAKMSSVVPEGTVAKINEFIKSGPKQPVEVVVPKSAPTPEPKTLEPTDITTGSQSIPVTPITDPPSTSPRDSSKGNKGK